MSTHNRLGNRPVFKLCAFNVRELSPATDGCRQRMTGLLHNMGAGLEVEYIGCNQDRGGIPRTTRVFGTITETIVPLDPKSFDRVDALQEQAPGDNMMECAFASVAPPSGDFLTALHAGVRDADIVMLSQPWIYRCMRDVIDWSRQLVIYDAHNVETLLRRRLVQDTPLARQVISQLAADERDLCRRADMVLTCTHEDRLLLHTLFGISPAKIFVYPNGCFARSGGIVNDGDRLAAKEATGIDSNIPAVIYIGSNYGPNVRAATRILEGLAPVVPEATFLIVGSVCDALAGYMTVPPNVRMTGPVDDEEKRILLLASDLALNPVDTGSGSSIKMFEYMSAALPVLSTAVGARGLTGRHPQPCMIADQDEMSRALRALVLDPDRRKELSVRGWETVKNSFDWTEISGHLGRVLYRQRLLRAEHRPRVSVLVCTYERHAKLDVLLRCLEKQSFGDFEVIIVDQSAREWPGESSSFRLDICYVRRDVAALPAARNTAALYARGEILAFTDDDCEPDVNWLLNAERMFKRNDVVGVEGLILSADVDDSYRTVTNTGTRGLCFMGANLFVRREVFHVIDGFDEDFGQFFREDTDFAWRALSLGAVGFCEDAVVHHPPVARDSTRESMKERAKYFENDALLLSKHPDRYKKLFFHENHWRKDPMFWPYFFQGVDKFGVAIPEWISNAYERWQNGVCGRVE